MFKKFMVGLIVSASVLAGSLFFIPTKTYAAVAPDCAGGEFLTIPTWYKYLDVGPKLDDNGNVIDPCAIIGPEDTGANGIKSFSLQKGLPRIGVAVSEILLRVAGMVAVGFVIFGGFKYMISQGEPDALKAAQGTITNALIGLVISILSTAIVSVIGNALW